MREILRAYALRLHEDDVAGIAAELAYRFLFAVFPFTLFMAALGSVAASAMRIQNPASQIVKALGTSLPSALTGTITQSLTTVVDHAQPGVATVGFLTAMFATTTGVLALTKALNRAFEIEETRGLVARWVRAIGLGVLGGAGILVAFLLIVGGSVMTAEAAASAGFGGPAWTVLGLLRWPVAFVILALGAAVVYRVAPNAIAPWRSCLLGGAAFAAGWLIATFGLAWYVSNAAHYGSTYGALGGVVVLMLWFYLTGLVLLAAGELTAMSVRLAEPSGAPAVRRESAPERAAEGVEAGAKGAIREGLPGDR
jgi:membrane protein